METYIKVPDGYMLTGQQRPWRKAKVVKRCGPYYAYELCEFYPGVDDKKTGMIPTYGAIVLTQEEEN